MTLVSESKFDTVTQRIFRLHTPLTRILVSKSIVTFSSTPLQIVELITGAKMR